MSCVLCKYITCRAGLGGKSAVELGEASVTIHRIETDFSMLSEYAHIGRQLGGIWVAIFGHTLRAAVSASMPSETMRCTIIYRSVGKVSRQRELLVL